MFRQKTNKVDTVIGPNTVIHGDMESTDTLKIEGRVEGNIKAGYVHVGQKGFIKGDVEVMGLMVGGVVEGKVIANEYVDISSSGCVKGDIVTKRLKIEDGGIFEGYSTIKKELESPSEESE